MIRDYEHQLKTFSEPETYERTEKYFEKYWLSEKEYEEEWLQIQNSIFDARAMHLPDKMFNTDFELVYRNGGNIFVPTDDFLALNNCMKQAGDEYFVIIQNKNATVEVYDINKEWTVHPLLKFKFPVNISWDEMMSGGYVSIELFQGACNDYFVFGDSGVWGKYVSNNWNHPSSPSAETPLNIIGYKKNYREIFKQAFENNGAEDFLKWVPSAYEVQGSQKD